MMKRKPVTTKNRDVRIIPKVEDVGEYTPLPPSIEPIIPIIAPAPEEKIPVPVWSGSLRVENDAVRNVMKILLNGKESQNTMRSFMRHNELIQSMLVAYNKRDRETFIDILYTYLGLSALQMPHGGAVSQIEITIDRIKETMDFCGFVPVAAKILGTMNAGPQH